MIINQLEAVAFEKVSYTPYYIENYQLDKITTKLFTPAFFYFKSRSGLLSKTLKTRKLVKLFRPKVEFNGRIESCKLCSL